MKSTSYKVKIQASVNGTTVAPKSIAWIRGNDSCLAIPCYKENDYFVIELIPDCIGGNCIEGYITFGDQCDNCEPVYFKKCFCNNSEDCSECEECNQYGLCQSICLADEFCNNGECCNCDQNTPCTGNKICNGCKCVCAQGTFEKNGICVECDENTILDKCHKCVNGKIIAVPCDGACDPSTGECVDCLTGGDCSGREDGKVCCVNKQCVCCDGTVYDPVSKKCIPQPCKDDAECGTCKKCTPEGCKPIECPIGYQCINDECVPECADTTCNNGADCGENCGCLDGKCVPCTILSCLDEASCQAALGCKCNGAVCEPVDNCNEYCDGNTPCIDNNCTCYNNNCVSCENFPCTDGEGGCNSYYNCKCNDEAKCEGGKECEDTLELVKKDVCSANGCELEAIYKSKNKCMCDPIEFRVANTKVCGEKPEEDPILLNLSVKMFKRGIEYTQFKTNDNFSDDEIVTGSIKVITTYTTVNNQIVSTTVTKDISNQNTIPTITIPKPNLTEENKVVRVSVYTQSIKVNSNNCKAYDDHQIAYYQFDFSQPIITNCTKLESYKKNQIFKVNDSTSTKKPLMIWYRTSGDDFGTGPVSLTSPDYAAKGYFRKKYLTGVANTYSDKISKPEDGLLNNFRYKVTIDCGCEGANVATTEDVLIYCCPKDLTIIPDPTSCGKKLIIKPFTNCSVNNPFLDSAKYPLQSITMYYAIVNGKSPKLLNVAPDQDIIVEDIDPIKSLVFYQGYTGSTSKPPVVAKACEKTFNYNPILPNFLIDTSIACTQGVITVDLTNSGVLPAANNAVKLTKGVLQNLVLKVTNNPRIFTTDGAAGFTDSQIKEEIKKSGKVTVKVEFANGCINTKETQYDCVPNIDTDTIPDQYSKAVCDGGLDNPKIVVNQSGFGPDVVYSLNNGAFQSSNEFLNVPAGTYTVTAKGTVNGTEYIATSTVTIEDAVLPTVLLSPSNICTGQSSSIIVTATPGASFKVYNSLDALFASFTVPSSGTYTVNGLTQAGNYRVTLDTGAPNKSCPAFSQTVELKVGGQQLNPTIEIQPGPYCVGKPIFFKVLDNGINATYTLGSQGSGIFSSPTIQANTPDFPVSFTPSSTQASILITGVAGPPSCNTVSSIPFPITALSSPTIQSITHDCDNVTSQNTVTVVTNGTVSQVTIGGIAATSIGSNTWRRTNIVGLTQAEVVVTNGTCSISQNAFLPNCTCPPIDIYAISPDNTTCSQGNVIIKYNGASSTAVNTNFTYVFQKYSQLLNQWANINQPVAFNSLLPVPEINVQTITDLEDRYRILFLNTLSGCEYISNEVTATGIQPPLNVTITPSITGTILTNQFVSFYTIQGDYTYNWSVGGTSYQSNAVTFSSPGDYVIEVDVCNGDCCETATLTLTIGQNCTNPPVFSQPISTYTNSCSNIQVQRVGGTGSGQINYTVASTYVNISSTQVPQNNTIIVPTTAVPPGVTDTFTITLIDNNGCTNNVTIQYQKCSCLCSLTNQCQSIITSESIQNNQISSYTIPTGISSSIYVWFRIGGLPDKLKITKNDDATVLLNTYQTSKSTLLSIKDTDDITKLYAPFRLANINPGDSIDPSSPSFATYVSGNSGRKYTNCTTLNIGAGQNITTVVAPNVTAVKSYDYTVSTPCPTCPTTIEQSANANVGIYVTIPYSAHQGSSLTFEGVPYQLELCAGPGTDNTNKALFDISCSPITFTNGDPIIP